ncbi:MAG: hypothetical protein GYA55_13130 [SAR324 cluster bacterium]|uniref:Uncharacterized protein n=1 Tax=SAR324 cluster bacterium TaxID=2024889 RepID=A0A7X9FTM2_9DELT|nr:hypothetical protein [SAR324 cluster bacterium]
MADMKINNKPEIAPQTDTRIKAPKGQQFQAENGRSVAELFLSAAAKAEIRERRCLAFQKTIDRDAFNNLGRVVNAGEIKLN